MCDICNMRVMTEMKQRAPTPQRVQTKNKGNCGRWREQIHRTRHSRCTSAENRGKRDRSSDPRRIGALALVFIVHGATAVGSFVMCSTIPWEMVVPTDNTTLAYNLANVNVTHHDVVVTSVVESAGVFTVGTWLENTFTQRKRSAAA